MHLKIKCRRVPQSSSAESIRAPISGSPCEPVAGSPLFVARLVRPLLALRARFWSVRILARLAVRAILPMFRDLPLVLVPGAPIPGPVPVSGSPCDPVSGSPCDPVSGSPCDPVSGSPGAPVFGSHFVSPDASFLGWRPCAPVGRVSIRVVDIQEQCDGPGSLSPTVPIGPAIIH